MATNETETVDTSTGNDGQQSSDDSFTEHESQRISTKFAACESDAGSNNNVESPPNNEEAPQPQPQFKRLLRRDLPFHQSSNILQIRNFKKSGRLSFALLGRDWFHRFLRLPTYLILFILLSVWTLVVLFFALIYMAVDRGHPGTNCGLTSDPTQSIAFAGAFAFSLETCTTVGYGLPDTNAFFDNCPELQVCIYFQMVFSMMFNAFLFSFFFSGLARCNNRGAQVLFSNKAIVRKENGRYMFCVQVYDHDSSHPLVEAHVRFYAIRRKFDTAGNVGGRLMPQSSRMLHHNLKFDPMRILNPDDDLGAFLFPSVPYSVSHHIDAFSPILPSSHQNFYEHGKIHTNSKFVLDSAGLNLREVDSCSGNRDGLQCAVCGETYATTQNLVKHIRMCQLVEEHDDYPVKGSHRELDVALIVSDSSKDADSSHHQGLNGTSSSSADDNTSDEKWCNELRQYLATSQIEILCVFEAIEPLFSGTFQCMQSYTIDDIVFDGEFAPCMLYGDDEGEGSGTWWRSLFGNKNDHVAARVDLDRFHEIVNR